MWLLDKKNEPSLLLSEVISGRDHWHSDKTPWVSAPGLWQITCYDLGWLTPALCAFIAKLLSLVGGEAKILKFLNQLKYVNLCTHTGVGPALACNVNFEHLALILPQ